ncbi:MAG: PEP-CTERM sorting domain-containing protein [Bryobacteraceae bacterium]
MKTLLAIGLATATISFANVVDISTGVASWQVFGPGVSGSVAATMLSTPQTNASWAPAPTGSSWISWGSVQGTSCVVGQTPGNGCANTLFNPAGDTWDYSLTISSADLGGKTSGSLNFIFGADNAVNLFVGNEPNETWSSFNPLGCSGNPPTSAGGSQATYNNCVGTVNFNASDLTGSGSLVLEALVTNAAINGCPACGDPTGFVLEGDITTAGSSSAVPEPAALPLIGLAGVALLWIRRRA